MVEVDTGKQPTVLDSLPMALGRAAVDVCLSSFPLALAAINLATGLTGKYISLRNEKQVEDLLNNLKNRLDKLENEKKIIKKNLQINAAYQEVAHKRLASVSALDSKADLELSANLIAICGFLTGKDPKDKYVLGALGEISPSEVRLFILGYQMRQLFEKKKSEFSDLERRDAEIERELLGEISVEFFNRGEELLGLFNFTHLIGRLHTFGLIEAPKIAGFSSYDITPKVFPPVLTPIGEYFITQLRRVGL